MAKTDIKRRARHMIGPILGCLLVAYFVYHSIQGDRGMLAWYRLDQLIDEAEVSRRSLDARREGLERRVRMLRPESLDADMVEEQGRRLLNFSHPDDVVLLPSK
jgi:cell division protein FtsB